jgi:transcriptional regulator with PAS, ATPase and Fis domain
MKLFKRAVKRAVNRAKQSFLKMMELSANTQCSRELLTCREMVNRDYLQLNSSIMEVMVETAKLVDKLKSDTKLPKSLREISDLIVDYGVMFVDYDGRIIFTNTYANNLLCANACDFSQCKVAGFNIDNTEYNINDLVYSGLGIKECLLPLNGKGNIIMESCCDEIQINDYSLNVQILNKYPMSENEITFIVTLK